LTSTDASGNPRVFDESLAKSGRNGGDEDEYMAFKWSTPITDEGRSKATEKGKQLKNLLSDFDAIVTSACPSTKETAFALVGAQQEDHTYQPGPPERRSVTTGDGRVIPMISLDVSP
jgi:broad specificity phosphatase PhoE